MVRDRDREQHLALAAARARDVGASVGSSINNAAVDYDRAMKVQRKKDRRTKSLDSLLEEPAIPSFLDQLMAIEQADQALAKLDEVARTALILRYLHGHSLTAVAAILDLRDKATKSVLARALQQARTTVTPN